MFCVICQHSGGNIIWYSVNIDSKRIYDLYLTLYWCMRCIQLVSGGSLVLDEGIWPLISCLSLWISSRWNWMIFSVSSKFCCVIKPFLPAEAAPEAWKKCSWEPRTWTPMMSRSIFTQVYPNTIELTSVTSRDSRALVKAALTLRVVQLHSDSAQLLTQIIDLFHKNDIVLDTDDRCEIFHTNTCSDWRNTEGETLIVWIKQPLYTDTLESLSPKYYSFLQVLKKSAKSIHLDIYCLIYC